MNLEQMKYRDELVRLGFDRAHAAELARKERPETTSRLWLSKGH